MNGMNEESRTNTESTNEGATNEQPKPVAFCQNCGKPLDHETRRTVGQSVYCEPCLAARLKGAGAYSGAGAGQAYNTVNQGAGVPLSTGEPNPGLAALLGLIPGVGAMYNEQYAKGIVHLVIFAVLVSLSHVSGIFGLFIAGWEFYMAIEAHHTAKARRDGTPLPNPFGFNDIGERMGFGSAWPAGADVAGAARDAGEAAAAGFGSVHPSFRQQPVVPGPPPYAGPAPNPSVGANDWGVPVDAYGRVPGYGAGPAGPQVAQPYPAGYAQAYPYGYTGAGGYGAPFVPPAGFVPPMPPMPPTPPLVPVQSRFPAGAVWLIGLGTIFLLGTTGIFRVVAPGVFVGVLLLGLGAWVFFRRMTDTGLGVANDGSAQYRFRLVRALRPSVWLILLGMLSLLNEFRLVRWEYSWPWFVILAGVMMLLNRAAYNSAALYASAPVPTAAMAADPTVAAANVEPTDSTMPKGDN